MRTYAEYVKSLTVKSLMQICKQAGIKGYSKLRKAELVMGVTAIAELAELEACKEAAERGRVAPMNNNEVTDTTAEKIVVMICCGERYGSVKDTLNHKCPVKAAPVSFSHTPVKAPESAPKATVVVEVEQTTAEDLKYAYQAMRATLHKARGLTHAKIAARMRAISADLRAMGVNMRTV